MAECIREALLQFDMNRFLWCAQPIASSACRGSVANVRVVVLSSVGFLNIAT